jgi:preprotein translocase subunit SecF
MEETKQDKKDGESKEAEQKPKFNLKEFYDKKYKLLLVIPVALLVLAILQISIQVAMTGDFLNRGVSLKGGITVTAITEKDVDISSLEDFLSSNFPANDLHARNLKRSGQGIGVIVEADIDVDDKEKTDSFVNAVKNFIGKADEFSVEGIGSSLGASFFRETFKVIYIAFVFMGMVVFLYFGKTLLFKIVSVTLTMITAFLILGINNTITNIISYIITTILIFIYIIRSIPSISLMLAVFSDIVVTLAVVNLFGMRIGTAGIAAFLMLIGYSVDTNILLSTKVIRRKEGILIERILDAMKTGLTMTITTLTAVTIAMLLTQSEVIRQIMIILLIGLIADIVNTWIQNVAILRIYMERKHEP